MELERVSFLCPVPPCACPSPFCLDPCLECFPRSFRPGSLPSPGSSRGTQPGGAYADTARVWQGIPGIDHAQRTTLGRLVQRGGWGGNPGNYALVATSGNDGGAWSKPVVVIEAEEDGCRGSAPWVDPLGKLWIFYKQVTPKAGGSLTPASWALLRSVRMSLRAQNPSGHHPS